MEVCPLAKTGKALVLDLVNETNETTIAEEQLIFGTAEDGAAEGNTSLNLAAAPDAPWNKSVDLDYTRLDLGVLFGAGRPEISVPKGATPSDIVCHLNYTYGMKFDVNEFVVTPIEDGDLPEVYRITAKDGNLAYTGAFDLFVDLDRMPLSARLLVTDLNGFSYPYRGPSLTNVIYNNNADYRGVLSIGSYSPPPVAQQEQGWLSGFHSANNGEFEVFMGVGAAKWVTGQDATRNFTNFKHFFDEETGEYVVDQLDANTISPRGAMFPSFGFMRADLTAPLARAKDLLDLYDIKVTTTSSHHGADDTSYVYTLVVDPNREDSFFMQPDATTTAKGAARRQGSGRTNAASQRYLMADLYTSKATEPFPNIREISKTVSSAVTTRRRGHGTMVLEMVRKEGEADPIRLEYKFRTNPNVGVQSTETADWGDRQHMLGAVGHTTPANNATYLRGGKTVDDGKVMLFAMGRRVIKLDGETTNRCDLRNTISGNEAVSYHTYDQLKQAVSPNQGLFIVFGMAAVRPGVPFTAKTVFDEYDGTWEMRSAKSGQPEIVRSGTMRADPAEPRIIQYLDPAGVMVANQIVSVPTATAAGSTTTATVPSPTDRFFPGMAQWQQTASGNTYTRVHGTATVKLTLTPKNGNVPVELVYYIRTNPLS